MPLAATSGANTEQPTENGQQGRCRVHFPPTRQFSARILLERSLREQRPPGLPLERHMVPTKKIWFSRLHPSLPPLVVASILGARPPCLIAAENRHEMISE